jgi:membrane protein insertase Oxa1/YidC/SpoIIIJ
MDTIKHWLYERLKCLIETMYDILNQYHGRRFSALTFCSEGPEFKYQHWDQVFWGWIGFIQFPLINVRWEPYIIAHDRFLSYPYQLIID